MIVVTDTSALVSFSSTSDLSPLDHVFREYEVQVQPAIVEELEETASYNDTHAEAARRVLAHLDEEYIHQPRELPEYPLDEGETAAIALANEVSADVLLCDEYGELSTVHVLLSESRLLTTPKRIEALVLRDVLSAAYGRAALSEMVEERSWCNNTYVSQFLRRFEE